MYNDKTKTQFKDSNLNVHRFTWEEFIKENYDGSINALYLMVERTEKQIEAANAKVDKNDFELEVLHAKEISLQHSKEKLTIIELVKPIFKLFCNAYNASQTDHLQDGSPSNLEEIATIKLQMDKFLKKYVDSTCIKFWKHIPSITELPSQVRKQFDITTYNKEAEKLQIALHNFVAKRLEYNPFHTEETLANKLSRKLSFQKPKKTDTKPVTTEIDSEEKKQIKI